MNWLQTKQELSKLQLNKPVPLTEEQKLLVEQYIPAIYKFSHTFYKKMECNQISFDELISYGFTTLINCAVNFNPEFKVLFITYLYSSLRRNFKGIYASFFQDQERLNFYCNWKEGAIDQFIKCESSDYDIQKENKQIFYKLVKIARLTKKELFVIWYRNNGSKLRELADELNISRERVRQIEKKALFKLKEAALKIKKTE